MSPPPPPPPISVVPGTLEGYNWMWKTRNVSRLHQASELSVNNSAQSSTRFLSRFPSSNLKKSSNRQGDRPRATAAVRLGGTRGPGPPPRSQGQFRIMLIRPQTIAAPVPAAVLRANACVHVTTACVHAHSSNRGPGRMEAAGALPCDSLRKAPVHLPVLSSPMLSTLPRASACRSVQS